jgi:hypothetical protein
MWDGAWQGMAVWQEVEWAWSDGVSRPWWAEGVVEAAAASRRRGGSGRHGRGWGNDVHELGRTERPVAKAGPQAQLTSVWADARV